MAELQLTDDEARKVRQALIEASWSYGGDYFDAMQNSWEVVREAAHIETIEGNGHGRVVRIA